MVSTGAFGCSNQRSELALLAEPSPQTYSYYSNHLDRRSRFPELNSSYKTATRLIVTETDSESSVAFVYRIQSSELGLLSDPESRNCSYSSSHLESCCRLPALNSGCREAAGR
eukprot:4680266-Pyramimonas_sp.AAC.1